MSNFRRRWFPSVPRLYTSLRLRSKEYLRENTLHGFSYFVNPRRPLWERIAWLVCTIASLGAIIAIIITIMEIFLNDPSIVGLDTETDELITYFPSVTLCKQDPDFNFAPYQSDAEHYRSMYNWSWKPIKSKPSLNVFGETYSDIFYRAAPNCQDLYQDCKYSGKPMLCDKMFRKIIVPRGICCSIEAVRIDKESGPWTLSFRTDAYPISVDVAEEKESPPERKAPFWYYLTSGANIEISIQFTYSTRDMESVSLNQRKCLLPEEHLSYNTCIYKCRKNRILNACNCLPWFLVSSDKNRECTLQDYDCLMIEKKIITSPDCECYLSCNHTAYKFHQLEYRWDNIVEINMTDWPSVLYQRDVTFGWLDLLVSFGGIAGLFLGYSLLTTVELLYYFFLRTYCGAVLAEPEKTIKIKVSKLALPRKRSIKVIDVKKDYYDYVN